MAHHAPPFTIDYPSAIECLRDFYASEVRKEKLAASNGGKPDNGLEMIREDFAEYPKILEELHGTKIVPNLPNRRCETENRLLDSLNQEKSKLAVVVAEIEHRYPDFDGRSFADLCVLCRKGLSHIYKQLAVHPDAMISKNELEAFCLSLSRINDLPPKAIPTLVPEQIYLQNIRERYFAALCIYQITCHSEGSCTRAEFAEKFDELSLHHKKKSEEDLLNLLDFLNSKLS